jgi:hypothetical protein
MPEGKPAGMRCIHLDERYDCRLFGLPERPAVCAAFGAEIEVCGNSQGDAIRLLNSLEQQTA